MKTANALKGFLVLILGLVAVYGTQDVVTDKERSWVVGAVSPG